MELAAETSIEQVLVMLFTDVEASTEHFIRMGPSYDDALSLHHSILRVAVSAKGGQEVDNAGDGFFILFDSVPDAVEAAIEAQRGLRLAPWPAGIVFRVRMGIHLGPVRWHGGLGFSGLEVHRASRISSAAHGGQCLVSTAARDALLASGFETDLILDRGRHRLKGFGDEPQRLFEVAVDGRWDPRPLRARSLEAVALPGYSNLLIGRDRALDDLESMLGDGETQLVTVVGPGGVGKTRLVVEFLTRRPPDLRVRFVDLAKLEHPEFVERTIAESLGIDLPDDLEPVEGLVDYFLEEPTLLVLDNYEQLLSATAVIDRLLASVAHLRLIVTSRLPLRSGAERLLWLEPLSVEGGHDGSDAVRMFKTVAARSGLADIDDDVNERVADLCRDLDGLPLAIEMAASRTRAYGGIDQLAAALKEPMAVLTGGGGRPNRRHESIVDTIDFSTRLLSNRSEQLLYHLCVLPAGATTASLAGLSGTSHREVIGDATELVDGGLAKMTSQADGQSRFASPRLIREFGKDRLRSNGSLAATRQAAAVHLQGLARSSSVDLLGRSQFSTMAQLDAEIDNYRALFSWPEEHPELSDSAVSAAADLVTYWWLSRPWEGLDWLVQLADGHGRYSRHRSTALVRGALLASWLGEADTVIERARLGVDLCRSSGRGSATLSHGLQLLALADAAVGGRTRQRRALAAVEEGLAIDATLPEQVRAIHLTNHADVLLACNKLSRAGPLFQESIDIFERQGEKWLIAAPTARLGEIALRRGRLDEARERLAESVRIWVGADTHSGLARSLAGLARVALAEGNAEEAETLHLEAWQFVRSMRAHGEAPWVLAGMGAHRLRRHDVDGGLPLIAAARALGVAFGQPVGACLRHELQCSFVWRSPVRRRELRLLVDEARRRSVEELLGLGDGWCP